MYTDYFHLRQAPFSIAPDPRYLFMSERHREALAHLLYGVGSGGGFVLLTGEIGAGKTTVCRCFIEQVPENCKLAYIFNPRLTVEELLLSVCDEFGISLPPKGRGQHGVKGYVDAINRYLLEAHARGRNNVLVIDEAQNLSAAVLEQLRLLTNLETSERKLLQIILIGQPELRTMLARPELEQLAQRVIARYHLGPLSAAETGAYVAHRLAVAGATGALPIPPALAPLVHRLSHGVPRRINLLCDRALLGAYAESQREVTRGILRKAAAEVFAGEATVARRSWPLIAGGVLAGAALSAAAAWQVLPRDGGPALVHGTAAVAGATPAANAQGAGAAATAAIPAAAASAAPAALAGPGPATQPSALAVPGATPAASALPVAHASEADALRELARLWGQRLPDGAPCEAALSLNLRCHHGTGGLYVLRQLDRPAIVTLHDGPRRGYAVLAGMDARSATLLAGGRRQPVDLAVLAARFDGEFTTFWKMPRGFRDQVGAGDRGLDVDWVAQRLAQVRHVPAPAVDQPFGKQAEDMLRAFQSQQNLKADGVAGPRTWMRLNQLSGVDEPRLLAAAGRGK